MQAAANGDEAAFASLFHAYYPLLCTHVFKITRSLPVTEEIVQDVFLKIWMGRESLTGIQSFKAFVWVMARNLSLNALKKMAREQNIKQQYYHTAAHDAADDETAFYHTLIDEAIAQLPPQQQKVYLLSRREKMKQAEIAENMGITLSTVKKYMQRAVDSITSYVRKNSHLMTIVLLLLKN
ncbi:RNA polymerase sigma factor [Deminuibacter soli]|nr:sigma-70 family RNA polymerase sigma factor [Deminuibacter soli]